MPFATFRKAELDAVFYAGAKDNGVPVALGLTLRDVGLVNEGAETGTPRDRGTMAGIATAPRRGSIAVPPARAAGAPRERYNSENLKCRSRARVWLGGHR